MFVLFPALRDILHTSTPMARYSLYVLKVPLNTKQTNKHYVTINNSLLLCLSGYMHVCVCMCVCLCLCVCLCV